MRLCYSLWVRLCIGKAEWIFGQKVCCYLFIGIIIKENLEIFSRTYAEMLIAFGAGKEILFQLLFVEDFLAIRTFRPHPVGYGVDLPFSCTIDILLTSREPRHNRIFCLCFS